MFGTNKSASGREDPQQFGANAHPRRALVGVSAAIATCAIAGVAVFTLVSSGYGSSAPRTLADAAPVTVTITSPSSGSVIAADHVIVRGTVTPSNAVVEIQGRQAAVGNGVFNGSATLHAGKTTIDVIGSAPGAAPDATSIVIDRQATDAATPSVKPTVKSATPAIAHAGGYAGETACGGGLAVGPDTTCAFAENVQDAYETSGPGIVTAYSPVTNLTYQMTCSAGPAVACTGGDDASVYFSTASSSAAHDWTEVYSGETSCGNDLSVGPDTTCPFAENVRSAYEASGAGTVVAYSPVTNQTYAMDCSEDGSVICTGGNNASVYFP